MPDPSSDSPEELVLAGLLVGLGVAVAFTVVGTVVNGVEAAGRGIQNWMSRRRTEKADENEELDPENTKELLLNLCGGLEDALGKNGQSHKVEKLYELIEELAESVDEEDAGQNGRAEEAVTEATS